MSAALPLEPCRHLRCNFSKASKEPAPVVPVRTPHLLVRRGDAHQPSRTRMRTPATHQPRLEPVVPGRPTVFRPRQNPQRLECKKELRATQHRPRRSHLSMRGRRGLILSFPGVGRCLVAFIASCRPFHGALVHRASKCFLFLDKSCIKFGWVLQTGRIRHEVLPYTNFLYPPPPSSPRAGKRCRAQYAR